MRSYWKDIYELGSFGLECPKCKTKYLDEMFTNCNSFNDMKALLFYCPACGHKNIETEQDIKDREKAKKMFSEYWAHYNEEC